MDLHKTYGMMSWVTVIYACFGGQTIQYMQLTRLDSTPTKRRAEGKGWNLSTSQPPLTLHLAQN